MICASKSMARKRSLAKAKEPLSTQMNKGDFVIVETTFGQEYAEVIMPNKELPEERIVAPLKDIIRVATAKDKEQNEDNKKKEREAFKIAQENIKKHKLAMNLVDVQYQFDNSKVLFYFTAEGRIDFRDLVKDLAAVFRTRKEQIRGQIFFTRLAK